MKGRGQWDDLRVCLAVFRAGSLVGAARELKMDATTVGRRVGALEDSLGTALFIRSSGWKPTEAGLRVFAAGERAALSVTEAFRAAEQGKQAKGVVRITTLEVIASSVIAPNLAAFYERYPGIEVHLVCTSRVLDLAAGEADIAIRVGRPSRAYAVARCLTRARERLYASRSFLSAQGLTASRVKCLDGLPLLTIGSQNLDCLKGLGTPRRALRSNSASTVIAAARAGLGVVLLPDLLAADLVPLPRLLPTSEHLGVWLVTHEELVKIARVSVAVEFFCNPSLWA